MRRHLWAFGILAGAVIAPAFVLLYYGLTSWKAEVALERARERGEHERAAEAIAMRIRREMQTLLASEHQRPYYEYRHCYFEPQTRLRTANNFSLPFNVSSLSEEPPANVFVNGYFQIGQDESLKTPVLVANPNATKQQVAGANKYLSRLRGVVKTYQAQQQRDEARQTEGNDQTEQTEESPARQVAGVTPRAYGSFANQTGANATPPIGPQQAAANGQQVGEVTSQSGVIAPQQQRARQQGQVEWRQVAAPQRFSVDRPTFLANRDAAQWSKRIDLANKGDRFAQEKVQQLTQEVCLDSNDNVDVVVFPFEIVTLDREAPEPPIIVALRRVEERDEKDPQQYFQGFEVNLAYLKAEVFPDAIEGVPARNFAARVALRSESGDRSIVRDLGSLLPMYELRAGARETGAAIEAVNRHQRKFLWVMAVLGSAVVGALFLFWRLLAGEVELGNRRQDFVSAVTHELKTPLTSIRMYAELLEDRWVDDPKKQHRYFGTIRRESERLTRLIGNVLDFSRLERGRDVLKPTRVDPAQVVRETVEPLAGAIEERGGSIIVHAPAAMDEFSLDRDAFTQVVINLVDNAIKYGEPSGTIDIRLSRDGDALVLAVENTGASIPRKQRGWIFDDFRRGQGRRVEEVAGVGLGLSLVRRFAVAHGGEAACVEPDGAGACFRVTFRALD